MKKRAKPLKNLPAKRAKPAPDLLGENFGKVCALIEGRVGAIGDFCKEVGIAPASFYAYMAANDEAKKLYARSKLLQCTPMADEVVSIADEQLPMTEHGMDSAALQRNRLRVDSRKWLLSKLLPRQYGDSIDLTSGGEKLQQPPATLAYRIVEGRVQVGANNAAD